MAVDYAKLKDTIQDLLDETDLSSTSEEKAGDQGLPDGFYLTEVIEGELTESKSGNPMAKIHFKTIEDGKKTVVEDEQVILKDAPKTANKDIINNYMLTSVTNIQFFVSDMLKFQDPETNESLFSKEMFKTFEGIVEVLDQLAGLPVYMQVTTSKNPDGSIKVNDQGYVDRKYKLISWRRAAQLELI